MEGTILCLKRCILTIYDMQIWDSVSLAKVSNIRVFLLHVDLR